jgi:hypothetical protein
MWAEKFSQEEKTANLCALQKRFPATSEKALQGQYFSVLRYAWWDFSNLLLR